MKRITAKEVSEGLLSGRSFTTSSNKKGKQFIYPFNKVDDISPFRFIFFAYGTKSVAAKTIADIINNNTDEIIEKEYRHCVKPNARIPISFGGVGVGLYCFK